MKILLSLISLILPSLAVAADIDDSHPMTDLVNILGECITSEIKKDVEDNQLIHLCEDKILAASSELRADHDGVTSYAALAGSFSTIADIWDEQLNKYFAYQVEYCRKKGSIYLAHLKTNQRAWIKSRDAQMKAMGSNNVPDYRIQGAATKGSITALRTLEFARKPESCD